MHDGSPRSADSRVLVDRMRGGDPQAMRELMARHLPGLKAFVRLNMGAAMRAKESCSDVVHSACRRVLENLEDVQFDHEIAFRVYLYRSALNKLRDRERYWSAEKRDPRREVALAGLPEPDGALVDAYRSIVTPVGEVVRREEVERFERAFDELSPREREIVSLAKLFGLSTAEVAARLGGDPAEVRRELGRALLKLGRRLGLSGSA